MQNLLALILLGISVGLDGFAVAISIGLSGINQAVRFRVGLVFGLFETGMPLIGLVIGQKLSIILNGHANTIGGSLLILTGIYEMLSSLKGEDKKEAKTAVKSWSKLMMASLAISIDNLIIGIGLGTRQISIPLAALVIGIASVGLALIGLELGNRIGATIGKYSELFSGGIIILVGFAIIFNLI